MSNLAKRYAQDYLRDFDYEGLARDMYTSVGVIPREVPWFELPVEERVQWTNAARGVLAHVVDEAFREGYDVGHEHGAGLE